MARHCKIKCKKEKQYEIIKDILDMNAIIYTQKEKDKPIHLCDRYTEKDIEKLLKQYGLKKIKITIEIPDFDKIKKEYNYEER